MKQNSIIGLVFSALILVVVFQNCGQVKSNEAASEGTPNTSLSVPEVIMASQEVPYTVSFGRNAADPAKLDYVLDIKSMEVRLTDDPTGKVIHLVKPAIQEKLAAALSNSVVKQLEVLNPVTCALPAVYAVLETNIGSYTLGDGASCLTFTDVFKNRGDVVPSNFKSLILQLGDAIDAELPSEPTELPVPKPVIGLPPEPVVPKPPPPVIGLPPQPEPKPVVGLPPPKPIEEPKPVIGLPRPKPIVEPKPVIGLPPPKPIVEPKPVIGLPPPKPIVEPKPVIGLPPPKPILEPKPVIGLRPPERKNPVPRRRIPGRLTP